MEEAGRKVNVSKKKMVRQLTGKHGDSELHSAARAGNLAEAAAIIGRCGEGELEELLSRQNQSGETALYVAAEYGYVELVEEMVKHYGLRSAAVKARNGFDPFHVAAKRGDIEIVRVLVEAFPQLSVTFDQSNTTALHTAAAQGHAEVVNFLLETNSGLATIARNNGKTALHSSARNGHVEVVKGLLKDPTIAKCRDRKGQTALHMAAKGLSVAVVDELVLSEPSLTTMVDGKGNNAMHIAARKGRVEIIRTLLKHNGVNVEAINGSGETPLDTAEKNGHSEIATLLSDHSFRRAKDLNVGAQPKRSAKELKQTVSDIKHGVRDQLAHTHQTQKRVQKIVKRIDKMHSEGLNNAINSTTVAAVLIATVAFAAIYNLPGQFADDPKRDPASLTPGEARIAPQTPFVIFFIFDSLALFISLAVVVVQISVVVVERSAKKMLMTIINKLMWLACAFVSIAFLALCYIVVGEAERWMAIGVTVMGSFIMVATFGTLFYWVVVHRIESTNMRNLSRSRSSLSQSRSMSVMSDEDGHEDEFNKKLYAI